MESKYKKKIPRTKAEELAKEKELRKLTLQAHKLETLLIKLVIDVSSLEERSEAESQIRHALDSIKKATRLLARGR